MYCSRSGKFAGYPTYFAAVLGDVQTRSTQRTAEVGAYPYTRGNKLQQRAPRWVTEGIVCRESYRREKVRPRKFVTLCCTKCGKPKNDKDFYKEKRNRDGLRSICKTCSLTTLNKEKKSIATKIWYEKNKEKLNAYQRKWKKENKEKWSTSQSIRVRLRRFIKENKGIKKNSTEKIVGCTSRELKIHIEKQFLIGMDWSNYGKWHIDHIVPLSNAETVEQAESLCHHTNLRPIWAKDNLQKSSKNLFLI